MGWLQLQFALAKRATYRGAGHNGLACQISDSLAVGMGWNPDDGSQERLLVLNGYASYGSDLTSDIL